MAIQTASVQRGAPTSQRVPHHAWSSRYSTPQRWHDQSLKARYVPLSVPLPATTGETPRILIVDHADITGPLESLLHGLGFWTTRVALCADSALTMARDFLPSVVLLTLDLPDLSSYRVAAQLRDRAAGRELRLIAMTADHAPAGRDRARRAGFERYLAKPVSIGALNQLLRSPQF